MGKFVLLDRDGVINQERGKHTFLPSDFKWVDGFWEGMQQLAQQGFQFVVITNQSGIAKGLYQKKDVLTLNNLIFEKAASLGIKIEEIFYCPHHPDFSKCLCRKPGDLLFEKAIAKFNIQTEISWMIGDKERDIIPAKKHGIKGILIEANTNFVKNIQPILHG
ncbi:D-glycero-alpha-D-manno-heptose-1,7-bisphosphate 7-phosphatase [Luteibaculum oceani]|uniref:D,D-heptose 1,7-bisphosphate phosphatase n=1 Tax=Luteibaculum oceani TaxID=1294296 RepID=A0A5C6US07_9FLAO|nr:HAD-IIIA family hydrolase [Luteibaculum oceani]TXC76102.1 HAD-IIIA family hydrolase [Luteibaculum oceani]